MFVFTTRTEACRKRENVQTAAGHENSLPEIDPFLLAVQPIISSLHSLSFTKRQFEKSLTIVEL